MRQLGDLNVPPNPMGRPYQNDLLPPNLRDEMRNDYFPKELGGTVYGAADIDTPDPGDRTKGVAPIGDLPATPSQPGHGDHTPSKGTI
jgi:hypothetical protein